MESATSYFFSLPSKQGCLYHNEILTHSVCGKVFIFCHDLPLSSPSSPPPPPYHLTSSPTPRQYISIEFHSLPFLFAAPAMKQQPSSNKPANLISTPYSEHSNDSGTTSTPYL